MAASAALSGFVRRPITAAGRHRPQLQSFSCRLVAAESRGSASAVTDVTAVAGKGSPAAANTVYCLRQENSIWPSRPTW